MSKTLLNPSVATPQGAPTPALQLTIDVVNDLDPTSSLAALLNAGENAVFGIAREVATFAGQPLRNAAAAKATAQLILTAPASWTLPNGIGFSLSAAASCSISIDTVSETFTVATAPDSSDTTNIAVGPKAGLAYINIDLDFSIQGSAAGTGAVGGLGISGTLAGGRSATLSFCQPVNDNLETVAALKAAFSQIVFPLHPDAIKDMQNGALTRVVFDGSFSAEVDATYGLGDHTFAAPSVDGVLASVAKVIELTPPSVALSGGFNASVTYKHTDHFALLINKTADTIATVSLVRALQSDAGLAAGFKFGVTVTSINVSVDDAALRKTVKQVTGSDGLSTAIVNAASQPGNNLTTNLNGKLNRWATDVSGEIGLTAGLQKQTSRATLYNFEADLADPKLIQTSWKALVAGDIFQALQAGGLKLQPGSGVSQSLKRSTTIHFQFFNLFVFDQVTDFFQKATAELGPDGSIRLLAQIGEEQNDATRKTLTAVRIYFVAAANATTAKQVNNIAVNLRVELIEANRPGKGATFEQTLALAPTTPAITAAQNAMGKFIGGNRGAKLTVLYDIHPSAYSRLSFSPFNGKNPAPLPQSADRANWIAFQNASTTLRIAPSSVADLTYDNWVAFNRASIDKPGSTINPDRSQIGATDAGLATLADTPERPLIGFFMQASQGFMNLIADLSTLANRTTAASNIDDYNDLLRFLTNVIKQDVLVDYLVPIAGALLRQCAIPGTTIAATIDQAQDNSALTCTLTLS